MPRTHRNHILVHVTIYSRPRIDRDGHQYNMLYHMFISVYTGIGM